MLRRFLRWTSVGPAWSLPAFLGICLLLRLPAVLLADGYEFADQQYQYIDPAWWLASGQAWLPTWEWNAGMRSWVYPGFLAGIFQGLTAVGFEEPFTTMRAARGVHAMVSLLPLWLFWLVVVRWRPLAEPRLALLLFAGSGLMVCNGVQASGPALGATLAVAAVLAFHGPRWYPALGGLLLGLAFCCRYQEALFGPAVVLIGMWQRRWAAVLWFSLLCLPGIALQGLVDIKMGGEFISSPWTYLQVNVTQGIASLFKTRPWYWYFAIGLVPAFLCVPPWLGVAWRRLRAGTVILPAALAAGMLHLVMHSFIARKAIRFEYGALSLLVAVMAIGICAVPAGRWAASHRIGLFVVQIALWLWASLFVGHAGPIEAASFLGREPSFTGHLLVVDGMETSVGGAYYLRRAQLQIDLVSSDELCEQVRDVPPEWVLAVRDPLTDAALTACRLELVGSFAGWFDLRHGDRRFVYRRAR